MIVVLIVAVIGLNTILILTKADKKRNTEFSVELDISSPDEDSDGLIENDDGTYTDPDFIEEDGTSVVNESINPKVGYWTSEHTGLDIGTIIVMDHASKGKKNENARDNYIIVLTDSGEKKIYRDVDIDLYLNLKVGDIIR